MVSRFPFVPTWSAKTLALAAALMATIVVGSDAPAPSIKSDTDNVKPEKKLHDRGNAVELVENSDFEVDGLKGWSLLVVGGGVGQLDREATTRKGETNSHSLRLTVMNPGQRCGVSNQGGVGIKVQAGSWYDLTFQARTEKRENDRGYGLTVSLESANGEKTCARTTLPEVGGDWNQYSVALHARAAAPKARLVITMSEPGTIWLDEVSLRERKMDGEQTR